jgi:hypothetical protein
MLTAPVVGDVPASVQRREPVPLIAAITSSGRAARRDLLERPYSVERQQAFGREATAIGSDAGRPATARLPPRQVPAAVRILGAPATRDMGVVPNLAFSIRPPAG